MRRRSLELKLGRSRGALMADSSQWHLSPSNLDQTSLLGARKLPVVMAGGAGERRHRTARSGQDHFCPKLGLARLARILARFPPKFSRMLQSTRRPNPTVLISDSTIGWSLSTYMAESGLPARNRSRRRPGRRLQLKLHIGGRLDVRNHMDTPIGHFKNKAPINSPRRRR